jgi:NAD(P)-dependent dehydrogenase (short-subunit alcohol dehydrogenase family)
MSDTTKRDTNKSVVAVFGATGYTGRFVVAELLRRGMAPIAIARDIKALSAAVFPEDVVRRQATVDDAESLDHALKGAQAVINCAGPFVDTVEAIAGAAVRAGIHYVDVAAEQVSASLTLDKLDEPARKAGVVVIPSVAYFGGFTDLMATATAGDWDAVDSIEVLIGFDRWHPTQGTRNTIARNSVGNLMVSDGRLMEVPASPRQKLWQFADPVGEQAVVELPFAEVVLIARHIKTKELHTYLTQVAISDVLDPKTPPPKAVDDIGRSAQNFVVDVVVTRDGKRRTATARGRDGYAMTAPLSCEAVARLINGQFHSPGAFTAGQVFDARSILATLGPDYPVSITAD